jgi:YqjK-like protein
MKTRMAELAARRRALIAQAAAQRELAAALAVEIRRKLTFLDRVTRFLDRVKRKPLAAGVVAALIGLVMAKPRKAIKWLGYGLTAYSIVRRARRLLSTPR